PRCAPAAADRTLLPGLDQPIARVRRYRPGPGHRQARTEPAPGTAGDHQRGRARQRVFLSFRPRARAGARWRPSRSSPVTRSGQAAPPRKPRKNPSRQVAAAPGEPVGADGLREPSLYFNRELSQLDFNFRVLAQALDDTVPLLERLRYLCISCTNLDEF